MRLSYINGQLIEVEDVPNLDDAVMVEPEEETSQEEALQSFFEGLASGETNSIAKIRALAQKFIDSTNVGGDTDE